MPLMVFFYFSSLPQRQRSDWSQELWMLRSRMTDFQHESNINCILQAKHLKRTQNFWLFSLPICCSKLCLCWTLPVILFRSAATIVIWLILASPACVSLAIDFPTLFKLIMRCNTLYYCDPGWFNWISRGMKQVADLQLRPCNSIFLAHKWQ